MFRSFIGCRIDRSAALVALHARLSRLGRNFPPVPPESWHLTLKFLGEIHDDVLPRVAQAMMQQAARRAPCMIDLHGLGAFPHAARPAVIWVGVRNAAGLRELAADLETALAELGFPKENRPLELHLTMLRVKSRPPPELFELLTEHAGTRFGMQRIDSVTLFESKLSKTGARYHPLATARLAG